MIQIIDYGAGNLRSVANALEKLGFEYEVIDSPFAIKDDAKIIFPGVGAAGSAMGRLRKTSFDEVIPTLKQPFLGICLGMQLFTSYSEENSTDCMGIVAGSVKKFIGNFKIPQMGWNTVLQVSDDLLFQGIPDNSYFYFVNSYYVETPNVLGRTEYGQSFVSVLKKDNFYGVQFHPEKSGEVGLRLLRNFCEFGVSAGGAGLRPPRMEIYPAIDIIGGKCVRLTRGEYDKVKEYSADPLEVAIGFKKDGAEMLHVIDLEGAKEGRLMNFDIVTGFDMPVQTGGGIRTYEEAKRLLDSGISRIILSTSAVEDSNLVECLIRDFGADRIVISVDVKSGGIATRGWLEISEMPIEDFLKEMSSIGVKILIVTDVSRDGTLSGVNIDVVSRFIGQGFEIIVAGGVSGISDVKKLRELGVDGAIIGKALYEGNLNLKQALSC